MKNMILLAILVILLAFNSWWHEDTEKVKSDIPILVIPDNPGTDRVTLETVFQGGGVIDIYPKEDWECEALAGGKLRCQYVLVWPDGSKYYTSEHKVIDNPNYKPDHRKGEKPNRFSPCEI